MLSYNYSYAETSSCKYTQGLLNPEHAPNLPSPFLIR
jgi:hypothetical protein